MKYPRLIDEVLDVIATSKNSKGVPIKTFVENVKMYLAARKIHEKDVSGKVKKALEYCIKAGLVKQKYGYYKWGLKQNDYAVYKLFRNLREDSDDEKNRRRKGRQTSETSGSSTGRSRSARSRTSVTESATGSRTGSCLFLL